MQDKPMTWKTGPAIAIEILPARKRSPFHRLAEARACPRPIRIHLPLEQWQSCRKRQIMMAAIHEAEFAEWQASGGDFLRSDWRIETWAGKAPKLQLRA